MDANDFISDLFKAARSSYREKDNRKIDIVCRKKEYEEILNKMWSNYAVKPIQIAAYNEQLNDIKDCGCRVFKNSDGKHKIIIS